MSLVPPDPTSSPLDKPGGAGLVVYEWMAWRGFLASSLFPAATRLHARFDDSAEAVLATIPPQATHFLFHLNMSVTTGFPECRAKLLTELAARGIHPINDGVTDISKPFVQRACAALSLPCTLAARTMPADTLVMIKSSLNAGGKTEKYLPLAVLAKLGMHVPENVVPEDYKVMRVADVPPQWWDDPSLCIERYIANEQGRWHRVYVWQDRLVVREAINPNPVKKMGGDVKSRLLRFILVEGRYRASGQSDRGPERLLAHLASFIPAVGLRFGTLDAVSNDGGEYYIIDVNTTPFFGSRSAYVLDHLGGT
jgi:hypothetical protein